MKVGQKYLITTNNWFFAPDGENYRAVWGTVRAVLDDKETLGVGTNRNSTNWYVVIGDTVVAGCQVFYAVRADTVNLEPTTKAEVDTPTGRLIQANGTSRIWNADASGMDPLLDILSQVNV